MWEPVVINKYKIRLRALPASSDLRPLAALRWVWSTRPACLSSTSQQSASVVPEFVGRRCQLLFPPMLKYHGASVFGKKLQARTVGFDDEKLTQCDVWTWQGLVPSLVL